MVDYWLSINTNEKNFSHFIAEKKFFLHNNIVQQHFWHKINILSRGNPTKLNNYGNSKGVIEQKCPWWGGMDIFWNYTISKQPWVNSLGVSCLIKEGGRVNFSHLKHLTLYQPATLRENLFCDCTWHNVCLKRWRRWRQIRCRQYVSYRVTVVMQHNSLQSYILIVSVFWGRKKIKRTRVVELTHYLEKRNLTLVIY